jgi:preprotein translocase subunit SecG
VLTKATAILGTLFMIGTVTLGIMGRGGSGSLMRGISAPQRQNAISPGRPLRSGRSVL